MRDKQTFTKNEAIDIGMRMLWALVEKAGGAITIQADEFDRVRSGGLNFKFDDNGNATVELYSVVVSS